MPDATKYYELFKAHFTGFLRSLCENRGSMNQICRDLGINRQQFAKYLAGSNLPSMLMLQKISTYFSVDPNAFFLPKAGKNSALAKARKMEHKAVDIAGGYYMEHSPLASPNARLTAIGLWRVDTSDGASSCSGQLPGGKAPRRRNFNRFDGVIDLFGGKYRISAQSPDGKEELAYVLVREAFSPKDLVGIRIMSSSREDLPQAAPCVLRYIAPSIDVGQLLGTECGIVEEQNLTPRSFSALKVAREAFVQISGQ